MKPDWEDDWQQEMESHLQMRQDRGQDPVQARRRFGNVLRISEQIRAVHVPVWWDQLEQDLRYGLRSMRRNPGFTMTAVLTLALGTGMSTAVFSVVDRILFRDLPYRDPQQLVAVGLKAPQQTNEFLFSKDYFDWRKRQHAFSALTAMRGVRDCDLTTQNPVRLHCVDVAANFLTTFGMKPILGRDLMPTDDVPGAAPVALLSHSIWVSRFGQRADIAGLTLELNREPVRIIGVLPAHLELPGLQPYDLMRPMRLPDVPVLSAEAARNPNFFLQGYGRLTPGASTAQARSQLAGLFEEALTRISPPFRREISLLVEPLGERQRRDSKQFALLLLGSVLMVLWIACTNVANLLLARAASREREFSIRVSIGAGQSRLLRQSLTESALLCVAATAAGLLLAGLLLKAFRFLAPETLPNIAAARLDGRVLAATLAMVLGCTIVFGFAPLARARLNWFRPAFVSAQIALSTVLLTGASLFGYNLYLLSRTALGIDTTQILTAEVQLHSQRYPALAQKHAFFRLLEARLAAQPGVELLALTDSLPPEGRMSLNLAANMRIEGQDHRQQAALGGMVVHRYVTPGYFEILRIPIVEGRPFVERDRDEATPPVILSQSFSRSLFPQGGAVGRRIGAGEGPFKLVVGVAADARNAGLSGKDLPEFYEAQGAQESPGAGFSYVLMKTSGDRKQLIRAVREHVRALDPGLPVQFETLDQRVSQLTSKQKFQSALIASFALAGVLLAAMGLHGVLSFIVARRTNEIGLRMALGATTRDVYRLILGQAMQWTFWGMAVGLAASYPAVQFLRSILFAVQDWDLRPILAALILLTGVAWFAAWVPSRRAARIEAWVALRHD